MTKSNRITVSEAAKILGVSRARVSDRIKRGSLSVVEWVGPIRLLDRAEVEAIKTSRGKGKRVST